MMLKSDDAEIPVTDFLLPNRWGTAAHNLKNHVIVTQLLFMVVYSTSILILEIPRYDVKRVAGSLGIKSHITEEVTEMICQRVGK